MALSAFWLLTVLASGLLILWVRGHRARQGRLPPGPWPLPLLGSLWQIDRQGFLVSFQRVSRERAPLAGNPGNPWISSPLRNFRKT